MTGPSEAQRASDGAAVHPVSMRLNQLPGDLAGPTGPAWPGGGQQDLASSPTEKRAAAKAIEDHIEPDTRTAGAWADDDTGAAVKAFQPKDGEGWLTSGSVKTAHKTWSDQAKNLMVRLASEKAALRGTNHVFQSTDIGVESGVRATSSLDGF